MASIQCKMCGGVNDIQEGVTSGVCQYCGSLTTFPKVCDEQTGHLYSRAEHFRQKNDFDKAVSTYESILNRNSEDPEAYWGLVISRYGIEYVEDPATHERIPTCHRVQYESILADPDYQNALKFASGSDRDIYEKEAQRISEIQKGILRISAQEKPYDVFICYKETTEGGTRTKDSTLAQDIYYQLTNQGLKVFFSRITLEDKLGQQYEPYIFAALNSAKVMLVIGSKREYFDAVWVKNEWSRFLALMKKDRSKLLIPCYRDMDAYDIPEELSMFQSQDMSKIGFIQDILHGIMKVVNAGKQASKQVVNPAVAVAAADFDKDKIMRRISILMDQQDWDEAKTYCKKLLENDPENPELYFLLCLIDKSIPSEEAFLKSPQNLKNNKNFLMALKLASPERKRQWESVQQELVFRSYLEKCLQRNHVSRETDLPRCKKPLSEDQDFQQALKYASPEQKQKLLLILDKQIDYYLELCLNVNRVSSLEQLQKPLMDDQWFQLALKHASPTRKLELQQLPEKQEHFFLDQCMKARNVSNESELSRCSEPLISDVNFQMAIVCASPERRIFLQEIQERQTDYFLEQCMRENGVSSLEKMAKPLKDDQWFQVALQSATPDRKKEIQQIQENQYQYFLNRCLVKHNVKNVDELAHCKTKLTDDPDFIMARKCTSSVVLDGILFSQSIELRKPLVFRLMLIVVVVFSVFLVLFMFRNHIAVTFGSTDAQMYFAKNSLDEGDYADAVKWYRKLADQGYSVANELEIAELGLNAEKGNAEAQYELGERFGGRMNFAEAAKWYRKAAEQGLPDAQYELGVCYYIGDGVAEDPVEAVKWLTKAAEQGHAKAQYDLGNKSRKNKEDAAKWYRKAAEQGLAEAQHSLAYYFEKGIGVTQDYAEAAKWYRKAAEQGLGLAQYHLGCFYENGTGVTEDLDEAVKWYRKAAENGYAEGREGLKSLAEDGCKEAQNALDALKNR